MSIKVSLGHINNFDVNNDPYTGSAFPLGDITKINSYINEFGKVKFRFSDEFDFLRSYPKSGIYLANIIDDKRLEIQEFIEAIPDDNKNIYWTRSIGNIYVSQIFEVKFTFFCKPSYLTSIDPDVMISQYIAKCDYEFYKLICDQTKGNRCTNANSRRCIFVNSNVENLTAGKYKVQITRAQKINCTMDTVNILERID